MNEALVQVQYLASVRVAELIHSRTIPEHFRIPVKASSYPAHLTNREEVLCKLEELVRDAIESIEAGRLPSLKLLVPKTEWNEDAGRLIARKRDKPVPFSRRKFSTFGLS